LFDDSLFSFLPDDVQSYIFSYARPSRFSGVFNVQGPIEQFLRFAYRKIPKRRLPRGTYQGAVIYLPSLGDDRMGVSFLFPNKKRFAVNVSDEEYNISKVERKLQSIDDEAEIFKISLNPFYVEPLEDESDYGDESEEESDYGSDEDDESEYEY
jgi:hypothetical protein